MSTYPHRHAEKHPEIQKFLERVSALISGRKNDDAEEIIKIESSSNLTVTQKKALVEARIGQGQFRKYLIREWRGCAVMGCKVHGLLRASHIKPWKIANNRERLDHNNGLLLLASLDAAFECGLISFSDSGAMLISPELTRSDQKVLGISGASKLRVSPSKDRQTYLRYHRAKRFRA